MTQGLQKFFLLILRLIQYCNGHKGNKEAIMVKEHIYWFNVTKVWKFRYEKYA